MALIRFFLRRGPNDCHKYQTMSSILRMKIKVIFEFTENFPGAIHLIFVYYPFKDIHWLGKKNIADDKKKTCHILNLFIVKDSAGDQSRVAQWLKKLD